MNIDDRLEALAQTVELLALNSIDSDKRMAELRQSVAEVSQKVAEVSHNVAEFVSNSDRLWMLLTSQDRNLSLHEQRLDEHDNRLHNLDGGYPQNS